MQPESWKFLCAGRWKHRCGRFCLSRLFSCWDTQGPCSVVFLETREEGSCISPVCAYKLLVNHVYKVYKCHTKIGFVLWLLSSLTKQHSVQKMLFFIQTGFLNSALRSFLFGCRVLPLTKAYKFMTTSEASFFQRWFGVFYWGEEGMYRFCFFIQLEPVKKTCFWGESDYLIVSMIFCWCSLPT